MSINGALSVGATGLNVSQAALDVVGNNMANAATEGYVRRSPVVVTGVSQRVQPGVFLGTGVRLQTIVRHVDEALNARLRSAISDQHSAITRQEILSSIEVAEGELTDTGLSTRLSQFFNAWSELANNPEDAGVRSLVMNEGRGLADYINTLHGNLTDIRTRTDNAIREAVEAADSLITRIAGLNTAIVTGEAGQGGASGPRDERDQLLKELAELVDIQVVEQPNGAVDVFIESQPVVLAGQARGLEVVLDVVNNVAELKVRITADQNFIEPGNGRLGQLFTSRDEDVQGAIDALNDFTRQLMFELNNLHVSGQGLNGFDAVTGTSVVTDSTVPLNTVPASTDLPFVPTNGSFQLHVIQKSTGTRTTALIPVDLNGLGPETSLDDLAAAIDAVANIDASVGVDGRLTISSSSADFEFGFSDDTAGVLTALGINTFFTGRSANDIAVNDTLINDVRLLAVAQGFVEGDNRNALAINKLIDEPLASQNGLSLRDIWRNHIQDFATRTEQANNAVSSTSFVAEGLESQRQGVSGVNLDEESINLIKYQRAYQGSARFITVIDELLATLINLVR